MLNNFVKSLNLAITQGLFPYWVEYVYKMIYIKLQLGLSRLSKELILSNTLFGDKCRQLLDLWVFEFIQ